MFVLHGLVITRYPVLCNLSNCIFLNWYFFQFVATDSYSCGVLVLDWKSLTSRRIVTTQSHCPDTRLREICVVIMPASDTLISEAAHEEL